MDRVESAKQRFERDGLAVVDLGLPLELLDAVAGFIRGRAELRQPGGGYRPGARIQDAWRNESTVRALGAHPAVLAFLAELYGRRARPFQTLNFPVGTEQGIHSDAVHFNAFPNDGAMCGVWVALEDIDEESGPLAYLAGSHRLPEIYPHNFGLRPGEPAFAARFADYVATLNLERRRAIVKKGQAVVWAANLLHGGSAIQDPRRTRLSQVTHYFFEGSGYYWTPLYSDLGRQHVYERSPSFFNAAGPEPRPALRYKLRQAIKRIFPRMRARDLTQ